MSARDSLTVTALTAQDAREIARRQWERDGLRVVRFVSAELVGEAWRVVAEVEMAGRRP